MDGVLEQILAELKDIKQLIATSQGSNIAAIKGESVHDTMKTKEAAEYLGIALHRLRTLTKQAAIRHFKAWNMFLYKRKATPDGRHMGMPLADGVGACQDTDRTGPTALLASVTRLNNIEHWAAGNTCNIKMSSTATNTEDGIRRMQRLVTTFMALGGQELQINVVDAKTLSEAVKMPEKHRDLVVRVARYGAYFTRLDPAVQNEIISRTEQAV